MKHSLFLIRMVIGAWPVTVLDPLYKRRKSLVLALAACSAFFFTFQAAAQKLAILHEFTPGGFNSQVYYTNSDGSHPQSFTGLALSGNTLYGTTTSGGSNGYGTVFAVNVDGTGFRTLHVFDGSDGYSPDSLILSSNVLYGTTGSGGNYGNNSNGSGTVFALNPDGTDFRSVYIFSGFSDGAGPSSLLLINNTLYGTAYSGYFGGNVFAVNTDGTEFRTIHNFSGGYDGGIPNPGLVLSGNTLFGTTEMGGSYNNGIVFSLTTDGTTFRTLYSFSLKAEYSYINSDGANPVAGLVLAGNTLYGTTLYGGATGGGTIYSIETNGVGLTNLCSCGFYGAPDEPQSILTLSGNILYGMGTSSPFAYVINSISPTNLASLTNLAQDASSKLCLNGNTLYGLTYAGGAHRDGQVFSISLPAAATSNPLLTVSRSANQLVISWPTNPTGFALQTTGNLTPPISWSNVVASPVILNGAYVASNSVAKKQMYFRLSR